MLWSKSGLREPLRGHHAAQAYFIVRMSRVPYLWRALQLPFRRRSSRARRKAAATPRSVAKRQGDGTPKSSAKRKRDVGQCDGTSNHSPPVLRARMLAKAADREAGHQPQPSAAAAHSAPLGQKRQRAAEPAPLPLSPPSKNRGNTASAVSAADSSKNARQPEAPLRVVAPEPSAEAARAASPKAKRRAVVSRQQPGPTVGGAPLQTPPSMRVAKATSKPQTKPSASVPLAKSQHPNSKGAGAAKDAQQSQAFDEGTTAAESSHSKRGGELGSQQSSKASNQLRAPNNTGASSKATVSPRQPLGALKQQLQLKPRDEAKQQCSAATQAGSAANRPQHQERLPQPSKQPPPKQQSPKQQSQQQQSQQRGSSSMDGVRVAPASKPLHCSKCDGPHASDKCPHYKKPRDTHPDAQPGKAGRHGMGHSGRPILLRRGHIVRQPGDGSCLFHSLRYGLAQQCDRAGRVPSSHDLRRQLAEWVTSHAQLRIADTPLAMWVKWDTGLAPRAYAARMSRSGWGGGIEMAACSHLMGVNVWVYEKCSGGFERISCFDAPSSKGNGARGIHTTIHILYGGGVHYDALVPELSELQTALARSVKESPRKNPKQQNQRHNNNSRLR